MRTAIRLWPSGARRQRTHTRVWRGRRYKEIALKGSNVLRRVLASFSLSLSLPPSILFFRHSSISLLLSLFSSLASIGVRTRTKETYNEHVMGRPKDTHTFSYHVVTCSIRWRHAAVAVSPPYLYPMNETVVCRSLNNEQIPRASANFREALRSAFSRYVTSRRVGYRCVALHYV